MDTSLVDMDFATLELDHYYFRGWPLLLQTLEIATMQRPSGRLEHRRVKTVTLDRRAKLDQALPTFCSVYLSVLQQHTHTKFGEVFTYRFCKNCQSLAKVSQYLLD